MSSLVTAGVRSVAGKITRSGLVTRRSRPPASTIVASAAGMPGVLTCSDARERPREAEHLAVRQRAAERVRDPVDGARGAPGDPADVRAVVVGLVDAVPRPHALTGPVEDRGIEPARALDAVVLALRLVLRHDEPVGLVTVAAAVGERVEAW